MLVVPILIFLGRFNPLDDARIYGHYIQNAVSGLGLVFNAGEPNVNALTSPLFSYLLLFVSYGLHGHIWIAAMLLSGAALIGACLVAETLVPFAGMVMSTLAYFYGTVGMETTLLLFLVLLALRLFRDGRHAALPTILVLCFLTRAEAGALIPLVGWSLFKRHAWPRLWTFAPPLALLLLYFTLNHYLYGSLIPSSSSAKLGQGRSGYWGTWPGAFIGPPHLWFVLKAYFRYNPLSLLFLVVAGPIGIWKLKSVPWFRLACFFAAILLTFYVGLNLPNYHWYYAPFICFLTLSAVAALPQTKWATNSLWALVVLQAASSSYAVQKQAERIRNYDAAAAWIDQHSTPNAIIAAAEIGEIAYTSHRKVDDIIGLTEPKNATHIANRDLYSWLREDRPDYIIVHQPAWIFEQAAVESKDYSVEPFRSGDVYILKRKSMN